MGMSRKASLFSMTARDMEAAELRAFERDFEDCRHNACSGCGHAECPGCEPFESTAPSEEVPF